MITENGWPSCGPDMLDSSPIPGIGIQIPLQRGQPNIILKAWCADWHLFLESLYNAAGGTDEGGWTPTNSVATSNHLGGTAVDLNWSDHNFRERGSFSDAQMVTMAEMEDYYEGTVFWAGRWDDPVDEMHSQMGYGTYQNPHTQDFIDRKIRPDGFSYFRKGVVQPPYERKPVVPSDGGTYWADVSQYQGKSVDENYQYSVFSFRTNSGDQTDTLALQNAKVALRMLEQHQTLDLVMPYYFFRPGQANCDLHRELLEKAGLWNHVHTVSMVDVEGDRGSVSGDQSWEINDEVNRMRGWYGNQRRVVGYWNPNADPALWQTRPYMLELVIPSYGRDPGDLSGVKSEIARREAFAHQYTDAATDIGSWPGQKIDCNWTPYTIAELLGLFGLEKQHGGPPTPTPTPPPAGELDLTKADLDELSVAIAEQFYA